MSSVYWLIGAERFHNCAYLESLKLKQGKNYILNPFFCEGDRESVYKNRHQLYKACEKVFLINPSSTDTFMADELEQMAYLYNQGCEFEFLSHLPLPSKDYFRFTPTTSVDKNLILGRWDYPTDLPEPADGYDWVCWLYHKFNY